MHTDTEISKLSAFHLSYNLPCGIQQPSCFYTSCIRSFSSHEPNHFLRSVSCGTCTTSNAEAEFQGVWRTMMWNASTAVPPTMAPTLNPLHQERFPFARSRSTSFL